jgi:lipopolysaccharide heptosyltransferase I
MKPENNKNIVSGIQPKKILVIKPSSLGDILHTFPAVSIIADNFPKAEIHWLANKSFSPLLQFHPNVTQTIEFPRKELGNPIKFPKYFFSLIQQLKSNKYDLVIDFQGLMRSAFFTKAAKAKQTVGFAKPRESSAVFFYSKKIHIPENIQHAVERNVYLACQALNINTDTFFYKQNKSSVANIAFPKLNINSTLQSSVQKLLIQNGIQHNDKIIGISPVTRWISKNWPPKFFAQVLFHIKKDFPNIKFVIIGSENDRNAANEIINNFSDNDIVSLAGKTSVAQLFELIRTFDLLIANDSGPVHIASALSIPVFCMFGPTFPEKTGPYGNIHENFIADINCAGCLKRKCIEHNYKCHQAISPEFVAEKIKISEIFNINKK